MAYKWRVLLTVVFGTFMVILDATAVNIAIPTFEDVFQTDIGHIQWVLTSYLLTLGMTTPLAGYFADRFGVKRIYVLALGLFTVGSALCGASSSLGTLIFARTLQGIGGGAVVPLATAQLFAAFPKDERGFANGLFGIPLLVAPAIGPTLGGYLLDSFHWSWIFFINVPVGILGVVLAIKFLQPSPDAAKTATQPKLDLKGLALSSAGLAALLYGLSEGSYAGWSTPLVLATLIGGVVALMVFVKIELKKSDPIVDLRLFKRRSFLFGSLTNWAAVVALFGPAFLLPLYLQSVRAMTALDTGLLLLPQAVTAALVIPFTGRLYDRIGSRLLVVIGMVMLALTSFAFYQLKVDSSLTYIGALLALRGVALGCVIQPTVNTTLSTMDNDELPRGSSLINTTRRVMQALAVAAVSSILVAQGASKISGSSAGHLQFMQGFSTAFLLTLVVAIAGLVAGFFLPAWSKPVRGQRAV